jgi:hypothetical protein
MMVRQPTWQRIIVLIVLGYEAAGGLSGGGLLVAAPDGYLMNMPIEIMHGFFPDFLVPGLIPTTTGLAYLAWFGTSAVAFWAVVAAVVLVNSGKLSRHEEKPTPILTAATR